jgi:hypothetical protein
MTTLIQILISKTEARGLKDSSINTYTKNFQKFLNEINFKLNTIEDINYKLDKIVQFLGTMTTSRRKNIINPLLILLSESKKVPIQKYVNTYDILNDMLKNEIKAYEKQIDNHEYTERQLEKFNQPNTISEFDNLLKITDKAVSDFFDRYPTVDDIIKKNVNFQLLVIVALYSYLPPRRSEYADAEIIGLDTFKRLTGAVLDNSVFLVHRNNEPLFFSYGGNVVKSPTKINVQVNIDGVLKKLLTYVLKSNSGKYLFTDNQNKKINSNYFGELVARSFKKYHKTPISINDLRKIYISRNYDKEVKYTDIQADAQAMNHSVNTAMKVYSKKPIQKQEQKQPKKKPTSFKINKLDGSVEYRKVGEEPKQPKKKPTSFKINKLDGSVQYQKVGEQKQPKKKKPTSFKINKLDGSIEYQKVGEQKPPKMTAEEKKKAINDYKNTVIDCDTCKTPIVRKNMARHRRTKTHLDKLKDTMKQKSKKVVFKKKPAKKRNIKMTIDDV